MHNTRKVEANMLRNFANVSKQQKLESQSMLVRQYG